MPDAVLPNPVAGGDSYWLQPQEGFENRRSAYLSFCAARGTEGGRDGIFSQLARFQLDQPVDEALIREGIAFVYTGKDCCDFTIGGILRLLYLNKKKKRLSAQLVANLEKCLLDFKYWWDDPRKDIQYRCYHTENHQGLYHTNELLAAQLLGGSTFADGKSGKEHYAHAIGLLDHWLVYRMRFGFSEWLSNAYYDVEMMTLANLHDFAEPAAVREAAVQLLNGLLYDLALNNFHGVFGATHGRTYAHMITGAWQESTASIMKLMFGVGVFHSPRSMGAVALATGSYHCPKVIEDIATDYQETILSRQRQSIEVADAAKYGLNVKDELTTNLFWGMQEFIHPDVIDMSQTISNRYNTWPYRNYDDYKQKYQAQVAQFGKIVNPYLDRFALSEANMITLRTPGYMLSSVQDYRKGSPGYQQHIWQATLGVDAVVFTNHPASDELGVTPNKWAGNAILPRSAQTKNVLICIYRIPDKTNLPYSHAYFPTRAFDTVLQKNGWVLGKKGDGYIALYSKQPLKWETENEGATDELRAASGDNSWICEMGSASQWKNFEAFVNAISSAPVKCEGLKVVYQSPTQGQVTFGWEDAFTVNGRELELRRFPRYENQFSHAGFDNGSIAIDRKGKQEVLEFEKPKSALTAGINQPAATTYREVGRLVANRFVNAPYTNFGFNTPPSSITYSEVCAWYGALKFAEATNDRDLQERLYQRFLPLLNEKKNLVPAADHVDHTVFGAIPFELFRIKKDTALFNMGKRFADGQWKLPVNAKPEYIELQQRGFSWQTRFWIDDMFMINLIQSGAYRITGDTGYINRAAREMIEYLKRLQQPNGLFYHAPDVPFYWGRGNGWMAAGMTELLLSLPSNSVYRPAILKGYKTMMNSLLNFQLANGMWRQLIDDSRAWPETSCTGMFTYAMITGVKKGWLNKEQYTTAALKAWQALVTYINSDGDVREICEGTNKENSRQYYLERKRITGDMHGQAPVLWCAAAFLSK
ncbi:hypothetical protein A3860_21770 [Niastella vici]|uniref:Glycosyl hydrolase n=2 Tax=Niastella vici TaxID=1703345 RepID=A0A1V9G092_9BACT|nr:hypothetical protein A3860_21770 [Niastella vici]